jgi:hypothetical protein
MIFLLHQFETGNMCIKACCMEVHNFIYVVILHSPLPAMFISCRYKNILAKSIRLHTSHYMQLDIIYILFY